MSRVASQKPTSKPINQHWVPKFYLRCFATPQTRDTNTPQVWIFSKRDEDGNEKLTHVRNVCAKRFLYSPLQNDGSRSWDLEYRLGDVEALLGSRWPEFAEGYVALDDEHVRMGLSLFAAIMYTRNPAVREQVERIHQSILESFKDLPLRSDGNPDVQEINIDGQVQTIDTSGWKAYREWGKNEHDRFFVDMIEAQTGDIAKMLLRKRWSVVCSDIDTFITTDKPVALHHQQREKYGFATPGAVVTFPLGPKRMLVMDDLLAEPANQYYPLKPGNAGAFNMTTWRGSSRFMISGRPIAEVLSEFVALGEHEKRPDGYGTY